MDFVNVAGMACGLLLVTINSRRDWRFILGVASIFIGAGGLVVRHS